MRLNKEEEQVLKYIISRPMNEKGQTNLYGQRDYSACAGISEDKFVQYIFRLETAGALTNVCFAGPKKAPHDCRITLTNEGQQYFKIKEEKARQKWFNGTIDLIKFLIPTLLAFGSLVVAILALKK